MKATKLWDGLRRIFAEQGGEVGKAAGNDLLVHKSRFKERAKKIEEIKENAERNRKYRLPL